MNLRTILCLFVVICVVSINAQQDCQTLRHHCERCSRQLGNREDHELRTLNRECRQKVGRRWVWRDQTRCNIMELNCRAPSRRMDCAVIAELARMQRRNN